MMTALGRWNGFELAWLALFTATAAGITIISGDTLFGFTVFLTGVFCVVLAAKGSLMSYVFGMYNTVGYAYLAYVNGLFGEVMLNMLFYVPMNVVGFYLWKKNMQGGQLIMRRLRRKGLLIVGAVCAAGTVLLGLGLSLIPGQNSPYIDAATTVLSVVATLLMVRRFREQWAVYIVLNLFTVLLWAIRLLDGSDEALLMIVMWSAYLVNAAYGYYNWSVRSREAAT